MGWQKKFSPEPSAALAKRTALQALQLDAEKDVTSAGCIPAKLRCSGKIIAKSDFVVCGILEAGAIFRNRGVSARWKLREGQYAKKGAALCSVSGNARDVLACERTALNYLSLLSGIATKSALASRKYGKWKISATRKTLPMLSSSEKRAVRLGGCLTHRPDLSGGILIKDNHISAKMKERGLRRQEAIKEAIESFGGNEFLEVEVSSVSDALAAVEAGAEAILADNASPKRLAAIAEAARKISKKVIVEASGGITLENAGKYLRAGANFASTSELTMNIEPVNLSLEIDSF